MRPSLRLGRIAGIPVGIHYTLLFALVLITWILAEGYFPSQHPDWSTQTYWATGLLSALLLFTSVLIHELAHSIVAVALGMRVEGITLFVFGGVSSIAREPKTARNEFLIAIVGPGASVLIAAVCWLVSQALGDGGVVASVFGYLAWVNVVLALFNLLPGFPLDGGRVLRSIVWSRTGSLQRATNAATTVGRWMGWLLIFLGVAQILYGNLLGGIWIAFIGWFLSTAAESARREVTFQETLKDMHVSDLMDTSPITVDPEMSVERLVDEYVLSRGVRSAPVCVGERLAGIATLTDVKRVPKDEWHLAKVANIMTREPLYSVTEEADLVQALGLMSDKRVHQLVVIDGDRLKGLLTRAHIVEYFNRLSELNAWDPRGGGSHRGSRRD